jgi:hypothetical protein
MKNNLLKLGLISLLSLNLFGNSININNSFNYVIPITPPKMNKVNISLKYEQYLYDLEMLDKEIKLLLNNRDFKFASHNLEMNMKLENKKFARNAYYTTDFLKNLLKVLEGVDPYNDFHILDNQGYIKKVKDDFNRDYKMYLKDININNNLIDNSLNYRLKRIKENLNVLSNNLKNGNDISAPLKNIYEDLIYSLEQVLDESIELRKYGIIKPFTRNNDYEYKMPTNWAQPGATIIGMLNFILNGSHKSGYWGIKDYYKKELLEKENSKLVIIE